MKFEDSTQGKVAIFDISGKIMGGSETTLFHGRVRELINLNKKNVILDLSRVEWMNSIGIGMLISAMVTVKNSGGRLVLANIDKIENILIMTRLITVFEHFDTREEALKSLS